MRGRFMLGMALIVAAGCEGGGDPVQQALRDASAARHAAAVKEGPTAAPSAPGHEGAFAAWEAEMRRLLAEATGETLDESYVAKMIAHHQSAIWMAQVALDDSRDPQIRRLAQSTIDARTRDIAELRAWKPAD